MKHKRILSINDIECVMDDVPFSDDDSYVQNILDALEKLINKRTIEQNRHECSCCNRGIYCECWDNVR